MSNSTSYQNNKNTYLYNGLNDKDQTKVNLKLAVLKYSLQGNFVIVNIRNSDDKMIKVKITNDLSRQTHLPTNYHEEQICQTFLQCITPDKFKLTDALEAYRKKNELDFKDQYFIKLFKVKPSKEIERADVGRSWINYKKQLHKQILKIHKYIVDSKKEYGIWAAKEQYIKDLKGKAIERYGDQIMILKTVSGETYVSDEKEIIGDKFEVIKVLSYSKLLQELEKYNGSISNYLINTSCKNRLKSILLKLIA